jgi:predicted PurR-regulated permease PerM
MTSKKQINSWIIILLVTGLFVLSFFTIKSMIKILVSAALLSYIFYPVYKKLKEWVRFKALASIIVIAIILVGSGLLFTVLVNSLAKEVIDVYQGTSSLLNEIRTTEPIECSVTNCTIKERVISFFTSRPEMTKTINEQVVETLNGLVGNVKDIIIAIPNFILSMIFILFITFFMLIDGDKISDTLKKIVPLNRKHKNEMIKELKRTANSVLFGQIIVSLVQGITGSIGIFIGAKIFGISNPGFIIWGILMAIASLIPIVGTGLVWIPLGLVNIVKGLAADTMGPIWYGVYIMIWGAVAVANIDEFIRPKLVSQRANLHPVVVLISVFGGLHAFGFIGIFIGPIIISSLLNVIQIYRKEYHKD